MQGRSWPRTSLQFCLGPYCGSLEGSDGVMCRPACQDTVKPGLRGTKTTIQQQLHGQTKLTGSPTAATEGCLSEWGRRHSSRPVPPCVYPALLSEAHGRSAGPGPCPGSVLLLVVAGPSPALALLGVLLFHAARAAPADTGSAGRKSMCFWSQAHDEGRDVHHLLADPGGRGGGRRGSG